MTNVNLLKSKLIALGYSNFTTSISEMLNISYGAASLRLNNKCEFTQGEIRSLAAKLSLSAEDIKEIFIDGVD